MNKRNFLKLLGAGVVTLTIPLYASFETSGIRNDHISIKIREEDYGDAIGIAISLNDVNGDIYRQGIYIDNWNELKKNRSGILTMSRAAANALNEWVAKLEKDIGIKYHKITGEMVFNEIERQFLI